ncbi:MAG: hypothetical protein GVY31_11280 [Alphaproteobacteria bacterium]|jgi:hypothetical protein|nr:hypothetical protein [Alphaproteobacteria bacterium]
MTDTIPCRGAAPVGQIADLPAHEAAAVLFLRRWTGTEQVERTAGQEADYYLAQIFEMLHRFGRRPLMRHHAGCSCLGADEACFAQLIGGASDGDREDTMMIACLLVRADAAPILTDIAQMAALHLRRRGAKVQSATAQDRACPARPVLH